MPRKSSTLFFTATPDLKDKIESIAKAANISRSKAIAGLVRQGINSSELSSLHSKSDDKLSLAPTATENQEAPQHQTSLKQLEFEKLIELFEIYDFYTHSERDGYVLRACDLNYKQWWAEEDAGQTWEKERPIYERFCAIADEINEILWQIDNTTRLDIPYGVTEHFDTWNACEKLAEYGLLQPCHHSPCSARELWDFLQTEDLPDNISSIIASAVRAKRLDVLSAMLPWKPPIERGAYWKNYYSSCIGNAKVKDVWCWKDNPEAFQICEELSTVLDWERPEHDVKMVLDVLHENKDPFYKKESNPQRNGQFITANLGDYLAGGKFQDWEDDRKTKVKNKFRQWHSDRLQELGQERLQRCYKVVFGCDWDVIESLIMPVLSGEWWEILGVKPNCLDAELKRAYREMAKRYHPDVNKSDAAKRAIQAINRAKEEGDKAIRSRQKQSYDGYGTFANQEEYMRDICRQMGISYPF